MRSLSTEHLPPPVIAVTDSEIGAAPSSVDTGAKAEPMPMSSSWVGETEKINGVAQFPDGVTHAIPPDFGSLQCKYVHLAPPCSSYSQAPHPEVRTCVHMFHPDSNNIFFVFSGHIVWAFFNLQPFNNFLYSCLHRQEPSIPQPENEEGQGWRGAEDSKHYHQTCVEST